MLFTLDQKEAWFNSKQSVDGDPITHVLGKSHLDSYVSERWGTCANFSWKML